MVQLRNASGGLGLPSEAAGPDEDDALGAAWLPPAVRVAGVSRSDVVATLLATGLVAVAFLVPYLRDASMAPVINPARWGYHDFADAAPLFGRRNAHLGWGTPFAVAIAAAVIGWGSAVEARLRWRTLLAITWLGTLAWAFALALVDGWNRGFTSKFASADEYLHDIDRFADVGDAVRHFAARILDYQPDSWTTQVSGHPPGAVLTFVGLDRIGLGGPTWGAVLCTVVGTSAVVAVLVTLRELGEEVLARRAAPFLVLAPAVLWIAVSADGFFTGVVAWGLALLALSGRRTVRWPGFAAVGAGVLLGFGIYLSYGLILMALPAAAILLAARTARPLWGAAAGALAVAALFTACGFWWFDGYTQVTVRYYQGVAADRPYVYWVWANFACLICIVGLASCAALPRALRPSTLRTLSPLPVIVAACLVAVILADLSGLSKSETERIWLPFAIWIPAATALLPRTSHRFWLILQALGALAINHLILTNW